MLFVLGSDGEFEENFLNIARLASLKCEFIKMVFACLYALTCLGLEADSAFVSDVSRPSFF